MPNNQAHDPRVVDPLDRVAAAVGLSVAALESSQQVTILEQSDFDGGVPNNWFVSTEKGGTIDFSQGFARGEYPITAGNAGSHVNISIPVPDGIDHIFIRVRVRYPGAMGGCKFIKVHGRDNDPVNYANATFGTEVDTGNMIRVLYGADGGDASNFVNFSGTGHLLGRADGIANVLAPQGQVFSWDDQIHEISIECKFNDGTSEANEVPNGKFYVEIDGDVYMDATGLFNRNHQNGPIEKVTLFNAAQNDDNPFTIDFLFAAVSIGGFAPWPS